MSLRANPVPEQACDPSFGAPRPSAGRKSGKDHGFSGDGDTLAAAVAAAESGDSGSERLLSELRVESCPGFRCV